MAEKSGFEDTAAYFADRAKRARDPDRRRDLMETAGFYRDLAKVIPRLPEGYKLDGLPPPRSQAERLLARAEECRTLADHFTDPHCQRGLIALAESYERLARQSQR